MAKGIGLIGNFKGKVGNMVGYKLSDSNTGNTQGIRVYQPIVKNPKTSAQAEQRAKLAPINVTYRALKMIIDRGNEGLPYGNKSRLAWLKKAFKPDEMPWFVKGAVIDQPVLCELTRGSLPSIKKMTDSDQNIVLSVDGVSSATTTLGALSTALLAEYTFLKDGDQITLVGIESINGNMFTYVDSFVVDTTSTAAIPSFIGLDEGSIEYARTEGALMAGCVILSREGAGGEHLRSTESLAQMHEYGTTHTTPEAKAAAIESYMSSASDNADWAEESIQ